MSLPPLGFITKSKRTRLQERIHDSCMQSIPSMRISALPQEPDLPKKIDLTELWSHERVVKALGFQFSGTHQLTGSCVGAGLGNCEFTLNAIEVIKDADREKIVMPFWLFPYGISRMLLGDRGPGEGSLGSAAARAVKEYGTLNNADTDLPQPENTDGLIWGESTEMKWSDGTAIPKTFLDRAKPHLIRQTMQVNSAADIRRVIRTTMRPFTFACNKFISPNNARIRGTTDKVCVGEIDTDGGHQVTCLGQWDHPELGPLYKFPNQWGLKTYPIDPSSGTGYAVWVVEKNVDLAIKNEDAEVIWFGDYDGEPSADPVIIDFYRNLYSW